MMVYAEVPPIEKSQYLERLATNLPGLDVDYLRYVAIGLSLEEKVAMAKSLVEAGTISNWRYASELGADLARIGAMGTAMPLLQMAAQRISERLPARGA